MSVYLLLMILPFILGLIFHNSKNIEKQNNRITWTFFLFVLILFVVRDFSVGRDMPGYAETFERSSSYDLFDSDWIYMETGYVVLMQFANIIGLSFRGFLLLLYGLVTVPLAYYISRSSKDVVLSLVIYVCFQFFVFNMSAFRQSAAMGLCLWAFLEAHKNGKLAFLKYSILVALAISIHKSSIVFIPAYFLMRQRLSPRMGLVYLLIAFLSIVLRREILGFFQDNEYTNYQFQESLTVGSAFVFTLAVVVYAVLSSSKNDNETSFINIKKNVFASAQKIELGLSNYSNLLVCSIVLLLAFSGSILMRASSVYQLSILVVLPNMLNAKTNGFNQVLRVLVIIIMFAIFYYTVLVPNQFDIIPYKVSNNLSIIR